MIIWRPPSLSELTPMIFNTGLTHSSSETSIYKGSLGSHFDYLGDSSVKKYHKYTTFLCISSFMMYGL